MCRMIVVVWLMDDPEVVRAITDGLSRLQMEVKSVTLVCDGEQLTGRWKNDHNCEFRAALPGCGNCAEYDSDVSEWSDKDNAAYN